MGTRSRIDRESRVVEGAARYLGETFRRAGGGEWSWMDDSGPYVVNPGSTGRSQLPVVQLRTGMRTPGYLPERCKALAE
jgi:hypothetical protein